MPIKNLKSFIRPKVYFLPPTIWPRKLVSFSKNYYQAPFLLPRKITKMIMSLGMAVPRKISLLEEFNIPRRLRKIKYIPLGIGE